MIINFFSEDHALGLSTFTIMAGLGGAMGYMMGGIDWGWLGEWQKIFLIDCEKFLLRCYYIYDDFIKFTRILWDNPLNVKCRLL